VTDGTDVRLMTDGVCDAKCDGEGLRDRAGLCAAVC